MSDRDYYEILGLTRAADGAMVDQAYWHLARKYQSLATTNPRASQMLDELNEAYGVIGSPKLREQYDSFRDDILASTGVIQPVRPSLKRSVGRQSSGVMGRRRQSKLPLRISELRRPHWCAYAGGAVLVAFAVAGASQGVSTVVVIGAVAAGVALSLTPLLRRILADVSPPAVDTSVRRASHVAQPDRMRSSAARKQESGDSAPIGPILDADELHASTAAMISRWRTRIGSRSLPAGEDPATAPSTTLVDVVESERDLDDQNEPLAAVIDILRGARRSSEYR
jgi:hypothetical protein